MVALKQMGDNYFDLSIVDPPYGLEKKSMQGSGKLKHRILNTSDTSWDVSPKKEYFDELFRVSKNQIIWGGNYFIEFLNNTRCFLIWDKKQYMPTFSACEFAWTSFYKPSKIFTSRGELNKIHPTQKPVKLYEWMLMNYAKEGDKILDTHLGSGSIAIACHNLKFHLTACEIDKDYFEAAKKRLEQHQAQKRLF
jgi:site-specific DNA-methyltransferase (adenine-specific)